MLKKSVAYVQTGLEAFRWLGSLSYTNTSVNSLGRGSVVLTKAGRTLSQLPSLNVKSLVTKYLLPEHKLIDVGAESIVLEKDGGVEKYLTGKSQNPRRLAKRLQEYHEKAASYLGTYLPETKIDVVKARLFKYCGAQEYVRIRQPFIAAAKVSPHSNQLFLESHPEARYQLADLAHRLEDLFNAEGLLMDVVNGSNVVWVEGENGGQLMLLDTNPVHIAKRDFTGIRVPLWSPNIYLEGLRTFSQAHTTAR